MLGGAQSAQRPGLCAECKLIARNRRLSGQPVEVAEPITQADALANLAAKWPERRTVAEHGA
jgi:hypothetical protein